MVACVSRESVKIVVIIQARMGSSRLPGKVLAKLADKPMLLHIVERMKFCQMCDDVIVATTDDVQDDIMEYLCDEKGITVFRGSRDDVLARFYDCTLNAKADIIVRITGDCPLVCPKMVDKHIDIFLKNNYDCVSPRSTDGLIRGLDNEIFSFSALKRAYKNARTACEREHVTLYFYNNEDRFKVFSPPVDDIFKLPVRLCVDEYDDLKLIKTIYGKLYRAGSIIGTEEAIKLLKNTPELALMNNGVRQVTFNDKNSQ